MRPYKPGFLLVLLPAIVVLAKVFLGILAGWATRLFLPIFALALIVIATPFFTKH
jgi:hypothetical protein